MSQRKLYACKNKECPHFKQNKVFELGGPEKFVCPLNLPNCEKDYLEPVSVPIPVWKRFFKPWCLLVQACVVLVVVWVLLPSPPATPPRKDLVVAIDGGIFLNAMMVNTPKWLAEMASKPAGKDLVSLGLWAFRPVEPSGKNETDLRNYTPTLLKAEEFRDLQIKGAPDPNDVPGKVRISYDLFSNLKNVIEQTKWSSQTNRNLIVVTATSGLSKADTNNLRHCDQFDIKGLALQRNIRIFSVHVIIPVEVIRQDQSVAKKQLEVLSGGPAGGGYYVVSTRKTGEAEVRSVSNYESDLKAVFDRILVEVGSSKSDSRQRH